MEHDGRNLFSALSMLLKTEEAYQAVSMQKYDKLDDELVHLVDPDTKRHIDDLVMLPGRAGCFAANQIEERIYTAVKERNIDTLIREILDDGRRNKAQFFALLRMLLKTEEAYQAVNMRKYDELGQTLGELLDPETYLHLAYFVVFPGQADTQFLDISDLVLLEAQGMALTVRICDFAGDKVILKNVDLGVYAHLFLGRSINIHFISSGIAYRACELALNLCEKGKQGILFNSARREVTGEDQLPDSKVSIESQPDVASHVEADDRLAILNREQQQAVRGILDAKCRPNPYILFGPPGTGKTHTLVEAVAQIFLRSRNSRVLFCVNSNTCVDQVFEKLRETEVFGEEVFRLKSGEFVDSSVDERVVVTTNIKSSNLIDYAKFDYVFLDEACHAHEPESMVPICSLAYDGCLVLAGDPKQLGPVVQFEPAARSGLDVSMLERIIEWRVYQRRSSTNGYDPRYLTKLLDCYRCDPRILTISNKLFYENELRCLNRTPPSILRILGLRSPVQMISCPEGQEVQPSMSTSWLNRGEVQKCIDLLTRFYKMGISPDQIGVMSPYKLQVKEIREQLKEMIRSESRMLNLRFEEKVQKVRQVPDPSYDEHMDCLYSDQEDESEDRAREQTPMIDEIYWEKTEFNWRCKIDTVDSFQGNERDIIIFSPVRSSLARHLGFLGDARRFNVAMSRARYLLIVVGSPTVLGSNPYWNELLYRAESDLDNMPRQSMLDNPFEHIGSLTKRTRLI